MIFAKSPAIANSMAAAKNHITQFILMINNNPERKMVINAKSMMMEKLIRQ